MKEGITFQTKSQLRRALHAASLALEHHIDDLSRISGSSMRILIEHRKAQKADVEVAREMLEKIETVFLD